jgi:hypothetical protein
MKRVFILFLLASACAVNGAEQKPGVDPMKPYIQVKTVHGDEFVVRSFYSPICSYSKQYFGFFKNLSNSLPDSQRFEYTPVINKADGVEYGLAFMAVRRFYPRYVPNFVEASMQGVQDMGLSPKNWAAIERIGKAANIPVSLPKLVNENFVILKKDVDESVRLQSSLKITNTPSVSVAGTYVVTPEFTAGSSEQFSSLVNGLISMVSDRR